MDVTTIVLIVLVAILIVAAVFLIIKVGGKFTDEERKVFLEKCRNAVKVLIAALADGKITTSEIVLIIKALVEIIACFSNKSYRSVVEDLGVSPYISDDTDYEIIVEKST